MSDEKTRRWLLAFSGAALAISISGAEWAVYSLILWSLVNWKADAAVRKTTPGSPLGIPILLFFLWGVLVTAITRPGKIGMSLSSQSAFALFWGAVYRWTPEDNERWLRWFVGAAACAGAFAIIQVAIGVDRYPLQDQLIVPEWLKGAPERFLRFVALRNERAVGTRSHPLTFAEVMFVAFVVWSAVPLGNSARWRRFRWVGLALVGGGIVFSQSRGVWLALLVAAAIFGFYWRKNRQVRLALALGALGIFAVAAASPKLRARALSIVSSTGGEAGDRASREVRFKLWSAALQSIRESPVIGKGLKGVKLEVDDPFLKKPRIWTETHNIFLQVAGERGLVGLGLFLWILVAAFRCVMKAPPGWREAGVALFVGFMICGLTESWIRDKEVTMIFWAALGAIERQRLARRETAFEAA